VKAAFYLRRISVNSKAAVSIENSSIAVRRMIARKENVSSDSELRIKGLLVDRGVKIAVKADVDALSSRGYGTSEDGELMLAFYEGLYLVEKGVLEVSGSTRRVEDFQSLLRRFGQVDGEAWVKYLAYRDLRSRGYVVREGFGLGVDFRVYERGEYSKDTARYLILSVQEGKPVSVEGLTTALRQSHSLKKELVLAVMNRRGEVVYYSVSQLAFA
jgi:tRNA-intron endonuclease